MWYGCWFSIGNRLSSVLTHGWEFLPRTKCFPLTQSLRQIPFTGCWPQSAFMYQVQLEHVRSSWFSTTGDSCWSCCRTALMKVSHTSPVSTKQQLQLNKGSHSQRHLSSMLSTCLSPGEREAIQKSVTRSCFLEEESGEEELSDGGGEEAAEAMEWTSAGCAVPKPQGPLKTFWEAEASSIVLQPWLPTKGKLPA